MINFAFFLYYNSKRERVQFVSSFSMMGNVTTERMDGRTGRATAIRKRICFAGTGCSVSLFSLKAIYSLSVLLSWWDTRVVLACLLALRGLGRKSKRGGGCEKEEEEQEHDTLDEEEACVCLKYLMSFTSAFGSFHSFWFRFWYGMGFRFFFGLFVHSFKVGGVEVG